MKDLPIVTSLEISTAVLPAGDGVCSVVRLAGEADLTSTALRDALTAEVARKPRVIAVDMTSLRFIDSGAMHMIVAAYQVFRREGGTLMLVNPAPAVARVLDLSGISEIIPVYGGLDKAVASVGKQDLG